jgi:hypothetical protein
MLACLSIAEVASQRVEMFLYAVLSVFHKPQLALMHGETVESSVVARYI